MGLERKASPYVSHSKLTQEERKQKLLQHLDKYGCITRADYEQQTGRAKHQAVADLNLFLEEGSSVNMVVERQWYISSLD